MFSLISFFVSTTVIISFIILRHFEIKRQSRFFALYRKHLDLLSYNAYKYLTKTFPVLFTKNIKHAGIHTIDLLSSALLSGVRIVEKKLHSFVNVIKGRKEVHASEPSSFFRDVFEHKNKVGKDREEELNK